VSLCETFCDPGCLDWLYLDAARQTEICIGEETLTGIKLI
jgi:hypothetical protein